MRVRCLVMAVAASLAAPAPAGAAIFCATTSAQLQSALATAGFNGQDDEIRIELGSYPIPAAGPFTYGPNVGAGGDDHALVIGGGWRPSSTGVPCGSRANQNSPLDTTLDGHDQDRVMVWLLTEASDVTLERLTLVDGTSTVVPSGNGLSIAIGNDAPRTGTIRIDRVAFVGNSGLDDVAISFVFRPHRLHIQNSLFALNRNFGEHVLTLEAGGTTAANGEGFYFISNTVYANDGFGLGSGVHFATTGTGQGFVANNVFWNNHGYDVLLVPPVNIHFRNNDTGVKLGTALFEQQNVSIAPTFTGSLFDFVPAEGSVLVDAGYNRPALVPAPPPFEYQWSETASDFRGKVRRQNGRVDIGAYESPAPLLSDGFEDDD